MAESAPKRSQIIHSYLYDLRWIWVCFQLCLGTAWEMCKERPWEWAYDVQPGPEETLVLVQGKPFRNKAVPELTPGLSAQQEGRVWCYSKFACKRVPNHHGKSPVWYHITPRPSHKTELKVRQQREPGLCLLHGGPFKNQTILWTPLLIGFWQELTVLSKHNVCSTSTHTQVFSVLFFPKERPVLVYGRAASTFLIQMEIKATASWLFWGEERQIQPKIKITESLWTCTFHCAKWGMWDRDSSKTEVLPRTSAFAGFPSGMQQAPMLQLAPQIWDLNSPAPAVTHGQFKQFFHICYLHLLLDTLFNSINACFNKEWGTASSEPGEAVLPFTQIQFNF